MARKGVMRQVWGYVAAERKWLLLPVFVFLILIGALLALALASSLAPFIYPAF